MFGDGRLAQRERLHQFRHVRVARRQSREDRPPGGIGERRKGQAQRIVLFLNHHAAILPIGNIKSSSTWSRFRRATRPATGHTRTEPAAIDNMTKSISLGALRRYAVARSL